MGSEIQFKGYEPGQGQLFPAFLSEALDPSDPALFVDDLVEGLNLSAFERIANASPNSPRLEDAPCL